MPGPTRSERWAALPPTFRGVLWMAGSTLFLASMYVVTRILSQDYSASQIIFMRSAMCLVMVLPLIWRIGPAAMQTKRMPLYTLRMLVFFIGSLFWVFGISLLPLTSALALMFTQPLFTVLFSAINLGERARVRQWAAVLVGFGGALVILRPGIIEISIGAAAILTTSALFSVGNVTIRRLSTTEPPNVMVIYHYVLLFPAALVPALFAWTWPDWIGWFWFAVFSGLSLIAQQAITRAFAAAPAAVVMPLSYLQLPLVAGAGFLLFDEIPDFWTWTGALIICASSYYVGLMEARLRRGKREQANPG